MGFDIHQPIFNRNGELDEKKADRYLNQIVKQYESTPEVRALIAEGEYGDSAGTFIEFGIRYLGLTPPEMTSDDLLEILFGLFPRKLSTPPEAAPYIIRELQALWIFLEREYGLTNAEECLKELEGKTVTRRLERELSDPANFGIAKSLVMMGLARGFDMTSEKGVNEWMQTYNAELAAGTGIPIPLPGERGPRVRAAHQMMRREINKRKLSKKSQKANRRKKK